MDRAGLICQEIVSQQGALRVAVVTETYPPEINGVAMSTGRVVDGLVAAGHRVDLIRPRQAHEGAVIAEGVEQMLARGIPLPRYANLQLGLPAQKVLLRRWSIQRPDVVQVVTEGPLGWSALTAARKLGLPVISEFHTNFHRYSGHYGVGWLKRPIAAYLRRFHNRFGFVWGQPHGLWPCAKPSELPLGVGPRVVQPLLAAVLCRKVALQMGQSFGAANARPAGGGGVCALVHGGAGLVQSAELQHHVEAAGKARFQPIQRSVER